MKPPKLEVIRFAASTLQVVPGFWEVPRDLGAVHNKYWLYNYLLWRISMMENPY
jgi:hypothetical protein